MPAGFTKEQRERNETPVTEQICAQLRERSMQSNEEIATALGLAPKNISSRTSQMAATGRLIATPSDKKSNRGRPMIVYTLGDMNRPVTLPAGERRAKNAEKKEALEAHAPPLESPPVEPQVPPLEVPIGDPPVVNGHDHGEVIVEAAAGYVAQDPDPEPSALEERFERRRAPRLSIGVLIHELAATFADQFMNELTSELNARFYELGAEVRNETDRKPPTPAELAARLANAAKPERERLKTITIIGLKPAQAGRIVDDFGDCFELRFWRGESPDLLKSHARSSDYVIGVNEAMGHEATQMVQAVGKKLIRLPGGQTQLVNKLTKLFVEP